MSYKLRILVAGCAFFALVIVAALYLNLPVPPVWVIVPGGIIIGLLSHHLLSLKKNQQLMDRELSMRVREYSRINSDLSRELMESRIIEEAQQLQVRAFDAFMHGIAILDPVGTDNAIIYINQRFTELTGYTDDDIRWSHLTKLFGPSTMNAAKLKIEETLRSNRNCTVEMQLYRKDGSPCWFGVSLAPIIEMDVTTHYVIALTDLSTFKLLEEQLRQSQKMEAIGHLAGGVAHDFNNILTIINGSCELMELGDPLPESATTLVNEIKLASERAATLTRQLLTFSRKAVLQPKVLQVNDTISSFKGLMRRVLPEDIKLMIELNPTISNLRIDPGQFEQVILNLVVNARDAMPVGGKIKITTRDLQLNTLEAASIGDIQAGRYVLIHVTDTGHGMSEEVKTRIFEPFFTTKPQGKGTGLGLAMVYGFIKASGGHISVSSEVNRGTTFTIYLPAYTDHAQVVFPVPVTSRPAGHETILLCEDEDGVRSFTKQALEMYGYNVIDFSTGQEAIQYCKDNPDTINLLFTDVVMPTMSGRELKNELVKLCPDLKVLYTSGHTDDAILKHGIVESATSFLQKPFTLTHLLNKVREVLDGQPPDFESPFEQNPLLTTSSF